MDKKLPWLFLILFGAQQLLCAPLEACAQQNTAGPSANQVSGPPGHSAGQSEAAMPPTRDSGSGNAKAHKQRPRNDAAAKAKKTAGKNRGSKGTGIHAPTWAFDGGTPSRDAWRAGTSTSDLQKRAVGEEAAKENSVNTASGINSALNNANAKTDRKNGLAVSVGQDESAWRKKSQMEPETADENIPMQSHHVVRAYADVDAGDDLNVRVGPELILKDDQRERAGANKQPESALGLGMQFKLGF